MQRCKTRSPNISAWNFPADKGIAQIIRDKGLKQVRVAEMAGFTANEMCDMLNGRKLIKACDILKFAQVLEVTVDEIYTAGEREEVT